LCPLYQIKVSTAIVIMKQRYSDDYTWMTGECGSNKHGCGHWDCSSTDNTVQTLAGKATEKISINFL
jgi:hypothetical protein